MHPLRSVLVLSAWMALSAPALGVTYEVGPGRPYATIQAAVDAAAAAEGQPGHVPNPTILIRGGVYNELVEIPFDPDFSTAGAGVNDGWTIKAAPGENVLLRGHMIFMFGRENFLIEDLVIDNTNTSNPLQYAGINFHGGTTRGNTVRNTVIYGVNNDGVFGSPAIRNNFTYGANFFDHVTVWDVDYGITNNTSAFSNVKNSIIAGANNYGIFSTPGSASTVAYSNFWSNSPNYTGNIVNGGNNVDTDPLFVSTDPSNPYFLWLRPDSPMIGAGENGSNMGAKPVFEPIWEGDVGTTWSTNTNWVADFIPNAVNMRARLTSSAVNRNVSLDIPVTLGKLTIDSAAAYTVTGAQTLTFQTTAGSAQLVVAQGSHTLAVPIHLASDTVYSGGGSLKIASLSLASGKSLDMTNRSLVVDYSGSTPLASLQASVASGYAGGAWTGSGIRSSTAGADTRLGIGVVEASAAGVASFAGHSVDSTAVLIRVTLKGDTNLNGTVGFDDLLSLAQAYNTATGAGWINGDIDHDGAVLFADLLGLAQNYGASLSIDGLITTDLELAQQFDQHWALAQALVPEPHSLALLGAAAILHRRRRR